MKKIVILLAVVALAAPAFAQDVEINLSTRVEFNAPGPLDDQIFVDVKYDATAAGKLVRGFSFDVEVDNGAGILAVDGYKGQGDPTDVMSSSDPGKTLGFGIYLGTVDIDVTTNPLNPVITAEGNPVANGPDSLSGGFTGATYPGITIECGSLYDPLVTADATLAAGTLFTIEVNKLITAMTLTADEDTRGGIIFEDGTKANLVCPPFMVVWGLPSQCHADSNGDTNVDTVDFGHFRAAFGGTYGIDAKYDPGADYNQDGYVDTVDFGVFRARFGDSGVPTDCPTGYSGGGSVIGVWPPII